MIEAGEPWPGHANFQTELTLPGVSRLNSMLPGLLLRTPRGIAMFSPSTKKTAIVPALGRIFDNNRRAMGTLFWKSARGFAFHESLNIKTQSNYLFWKFEKSPLSAGFENEILSKNYSVISFAQLDQLRSLSHSRPVGLNISIRLTPNHLSSKGLWICNIHTFKIL
jgi:hypothetical protein